jgi:GNAT superfamily N-acetyltransferase
MGPALIGHLAIPTPQPLATLLLRRPNLHKAVQWATEVENDRRYGLVATAGGDGQIVGHAGWEREPDRPERAEVALEVADAMQGKGLGTALLCRLAEAANQMGIQVFDAEVLPENYRMLRVIRDSGFPVKVHSLPGVLLVELGTCLAAKAPKGAEPWDRAAGHSSLPNGTTRKELPCGPGR